MRHKNGIGKTTIARLARAYCFFNKYGVPVFPGISLYLDPFTNEEFELISAGGDVGETVSAVQSLSGIKGVRSKSPLAPFKQDGFAVEYEKFKGKKAYTDWEFVFEPTPLQPPAGASNPQGQNP